MIPYVIATDFCAPLGPILTSATIAFPAGELLTATDPAQEAGYLNPADLGCPPKYHFTRESLRIFRTTDTSGQWDIPGEESTMSGGQDDLKTYVAEYTPSVLLDLVTTLAEIIPEWKHCLAVNQNSYLPFGRDPPRIIQPMNALAGPTTIAENQPTAPSPPVAPQAKSSTNSPAPVMTPGPEKVPPQQNASPENTSPNKNNVDPPGETTAQKPSVPDPSAAMYGSPSDASDPSKGAGDSQLPAANPPNPGRGDQNDNPTGDSDPGGGNGNTPTKSPDGAQENASNPGKQTSGQASPDAALESIQSVSPNGPPTLDSLSSLGSQLNEESYSAAVDSDGSSQLPNAPAFAQFDPHPLATLGAAAGFGDKLPTSGNTQANFPQPNAVPAPTGIGVIINNAFDGAVSSHEQSIPHNTDESSLPSASEVVQIDASGQTSISYLRSFNLEKPLDPATTLTSTSLFVSGGQVVTGSTRGTSAGVPSGSTDPSASNATGIISAPSAASLPGSVTMSAEGIGSQSSGHGKPIASTTSRGAAGRQESHRMWIVVTSIWIFSKCII